MKEKKSQKPTNKLKTVFRHPFLLLAAILMLFASCKQPETIVVTESPRTGTRTDTAAQQSPAPGTATFRQLNIGEINRIPSMDPLFADNTSAMRTLQLVYEGLVRYNQNGGIEPGLAKSWTVNSDSLSYRFNLRTDAFYHDSDVFSTGTGRKMVAGDVRFVFERMAKLTVPKEAARLFMGIRDFESYYREQHYVLNPADRQLKSVSGIQTPNDSTVVFNLREKDPNFLQKLASPYALIYPKEAARDGGPGSFAAVGTGPFTLSRQRGDSVFVFGRNQDYYIDGQPKLNRVDVIVKQNESHLFRDLASGQIHFIPELGPQTAEGILNENGELEVSYRNRFELGLPGGSSLHTLHYNTEAPLTTAQAMRIPALVDSSFTFSNIPGNLVNLETYSSSSDTVAGSLPSTIYTAYTSDNFSKLFFAELNRRLNKENVNLRMLTIRTPTRETSLYFTHFIPMYEGHNRTDGLVTDALIDFQVFRTALQIDSIEGLPYNDILWWMDLRTATLPGIDNL